MVKAGPNLKKKKHKIMLDNQFPNSKNIKPGN